MGRGTWQATVHRVAKSQNDWSNLACTIVNTCVYLLKNPWYCKFKQLINRNLNWIGLGDQKGECSSPVMIAELNRKKKDFFFLIRYSPVKIYGLFKNPSASVEDMSTPGSRRFPEVENGNPLQYSCLENFYGQRSLVGYSSWSCRGSDMTEHTHIWHTQKVIFFHDTLLDFP